MPSQPDAALVIPLYNNVGTVVEVVQRALQTGLPVIVVDDGSTDGGGEAVARIEGVRLVRHGANRGKGAALLSGLSEAAARHGWAVTLDADGQHDPADAAALLAEATAREGERPIVMGVRRGMDGPNTPWTSRFGRAFSNFWVWAASGQHPRDSQSGLRAYPLPETLALGASARHYNFEVEILVLAVWGRIPLREAEVSVVYQPRGERVSHFDPWRDFWRNTTTFSRLILRRLFIPPSRRLGPRR